MDLWHEFQSLFDTNDGSLPEIDIENVSPVGVGDMWTYLRAAATAYAGDAWFWDKRSERETLLDSIPNPAQLVVSGEAEPFHTVLQGITYFGGVIPDLGVFFFQDAIVLDYRMGHSWNALNLTALFELLYQLQRIDSHAHISLANVFSPGWRARFSAAFDAYVHQAEQHGHEPDA
jgi:hypothetical protein